MTRALLYARYSTTLQSSLSIDDQLRTCADRCTSEGWTVAGHYVDAAISGAVRDRPGLNSLLAAVTAGDTIVAESIDRISRDQEDIAAIYKQLAYVGARLVTLSEGEVGPLHIGLRGTMAAMQRADIADKVRRGQHGRAIAGANPGGMAYGYRKIRRFDARGEPVRGEREIDPDAAAVIRRIYDDYLAGKSARAIAEALNREGVPGPTGGLWRASTIQGCPKRRNGILRNDLYRGQLVYNLTRRIYHPVTRRREIRRRPESEWLRTDVPDLRIVSDARWDAVQAMLREHQDGRPERQQRPKCLLSGKAVCSVCGGSWRRISGNRYGGRWGCSAHFDGRACTNGRTITNTSFEKRVLGALATRMLDPALVEIYVAERRAAATERRRNEGRDRAIAQRRLADAERRMSRAIALLADERLADMEELKQGLVDARAARDGAQAAIDALGAEQVIVLHPAIAADYRRRMDDLAGALKAESHEPARQALRALIDRIVVTPRKDRTGVDLQVEGLLAGIVALATGSPLPQPAKLSVYDGAPGKDRASKDIVTVAA
jgi:site-specific DNA recombinase